MPCVRVERSVNHGYTTNNKLTCTYSVGESSDQDCVHVEISSLNNIK